MIEAAAALAAAFAIVVLVLVIRHRQRRRDFGSPRSLGSAIGTLAAAVVCAALLALPALDFELSDARQTTEPKLIRTPPQTPPEARVESSAASAVPESSDPTRSVQSSSELSAPPPNKPESESQAPADPGTKLTSLRDSPSPSPSEILERARERSSAEAKRLNREAADQIARQQHDAARDLLDRALKLTPNAFNPRFNRGLVNLAQKRYDDALKDWSVAVRLDPQHIQARLWRSWTYWKLGRHDEAIRDCDEALRLEPGNVEAKQQRETIRKSAAREKPRAASVKAEDGS